MEDVSFELWLLLLLAVAFSTWFRIYAAVDVWNVHAVAQGAKPVGFWWMFWATNAAYFSMGVWSGRAPKDVTLREFVFALLKQNTAVCALWVGLS